MRQKEEGEQRESGRSREKRWEMKSQREERESGRREEKKEQVGEEKRKEQNIILPTKKHVNMQKKLSFLISKMD